MVEEVRGINIEEAPNMSKDDSFAVMKSVMVNSPAPPLVGKGLKSTRFRLVRSDM